MKKVIAAAAGLMLVGSMVSTASAAVSFGGDARARWYYEEYSDGTAATEEDEKFSSRVRVNVNAESKGGAYAKAQIRMADAVWDGTSNTRNRGAGSNSYVDYAYIGVPVGPVTLEAGLIATNLTPFFYWDNREDVARLLWNNDMTAVQFWYAKSQEYTNPRQTQDVFTTNLATGQVTQSTAVVPGTGTDTVNDDDINTFFVYLNQKFAADWAMTAIGAYVDDQTEADLSGFTGTLNFAGPAGPVAMVAEFAYQESDLVGAGDDGYGGYLQAGMNFGATSVTLNGGFVQDGFAADNDFGFIMIGGASAITPALFDRGGRGVGALGDTTWLGGIVGFKVSEAMSLKGILAYANIEDVGGAVGADADALEISGAVNYAISDGASVEWVIGYLDLDVDEVEGEESPFGTAVTFGIKY